MMKIPDEFMRTDPALIERRGSAADADKANGGPPGFKPARRREQRRQRPKRHTTAVASTTLEDAEGRLRGQEEREEDSRGSLVKGESTGGLNRTLKHHAQSDANHISRWCSVAKIAVASASNKPRRGSLKLIHLSGKESSSSATPTAPPTPTEDRRLSGILTSASTVVRALSPLLTPAFVAANMANRAGKGQGPKEGVEKASSPPAFVVQEMSVHELPTMTQAEFEEQYDIVQKIGEGWYSRVYLTEHRATRHELVLKAVNSKNMSVEEFLREFHHSLMLGAHQNILTVFPNMVFSLEGQCCMFASEYAPLGDLTSNVNDLGIGEVNSKRVARQIGSALEWMHSKNLCHLDVKLDNILVFRSDFTRVKLCDFGSVKTQGDIVIKKNELLPYCPPELVAKHAYEYYQVDRVQDVFQFGIVIFFCLFGILPWQRADPAADPHFAEFSAWRRKRTSKVPKNFKPMSTRGQKFFKKLLDPDPERRIRLAELSKMTGDDIRWLRRPGGSKSLVSSPADPRYMDPAAQFLSDGISQLTMGSFQSVHSNAVEKNKVLSTLLQHGVETTVDRSQKTSRIINWIQNGRTTDPAEQMEFQSKYMASRDQKSESVSSSGVGSGDEVKATTTAAASESIEAAGSNVDDVDSGHYHQ